MNQEDKSIELAKLMGWLHEDEESTAPWIWLQWLEPYNNTRIGRSQFAAILLRFPEVIEKFVCTEGHKHLNCTTKEQYDGYGGLFQGFIPVEKPFTQESVLDEILKMNGVEI